MPAGLSFWEDPAHDRWFRVVRSVFIAAVLILPIVAFPLLRGSLPGWLPPGARVLSLAAACGARRALVSLARDGWGRAGGVPRDPRPLSRRATTRDVQPLRRGVPHHQRRFFRLRVHPASRVRPGGVSDSA